MSSPLYVPSPAQPCSDCALLCLPGLVLPSTHLLRVFGHGDEVHRTTGLYPVGNLSAVLCCALWGRAGGARLLSLFIPVALPSALIPAWRRRLGESRARSSALRCGASPLGVSAAPQPGELAGQKDDAHPQPLPFVLLLKRVGRNLARNIHLGFKSGSWARVLPVHPQGNAFAAEVGSCSWGSVWAGFAGELG